MPNLSEWDRIESKAMAYIDAIALNGRAGTLADEALAATFASVTTLYSICRHDRGNPEEFVALMARVCAIVVTAANPDAHDQAGGAVSAMLRDMEGF